MQMWALSANVDTVFSYTNCITTLSKFFILLYKLIFPYPCYPSLHPDTPSLHPPTFSLHPLTTSVFLCIHTLHFLGLYNLFFHLNLDFFISCRFSNAIQFFTKHTNVGTVCLCGHCMLMWTMYIYVMILYANVGTVCKCGHCLLLYQLYNNIIKVFHTTL